MTQENTNQYVVLSKETWSVIEALLLELPFKFSAQVVKKVQEDKSVCIIDEVQYKKIKKDAKSLATPRETEAHPNDFEK